MHTSFLVVGQGLCGTWLSYWLQQNGADFMVIDDAHSKSATRVASGIINPVTGRRMAKTWMADELLPFAEKAYQQMGDSLQKPLLHPCDILDFFSAPDRRHDFEKRAIQFESYLNWPTDDHAWAHFFDYPFGYGIISPAFRVEVQDMLQAWRSKLVQSNRLIEEKFDHHLLEIKTNGIRYKDIEAGHIIFCDGVAAMQQPYFTLLPFAINKGEALIVSIDELPTNHVYKKTNTIAPWKDGLFWVGSNYDRNFIDDQPTNNFRVQTEAWLKQFLKIPFKVEAHLAALRPTTVERRPFAGMHPQYSSIGILNGMGTKGVSLAPYFAKQLADHLLFQQPLLPHVDVKQYSRVLQRL